MIHTTNPTHLRVQIVHLYRGQCPKESQIVFVYLAEMKIMEQFTCKKKNPPTTSSCLLQSDKIELDGSNLDLEKLKEQRI